MLFVDELAEGVGEVLGASWGIPLMAVAAVAMVGAPRAKPLAKGAIKGYLKVTERMRELAAEATEQIQDLYAEAKYEYHSQLPADEPATVDEASAALESAARPRRRPAASSELVTPTGEPA